MVAEGRSASWLAERLNCSRSNVYKIYESRTINTNLLFRISQALDYDFFEACSEQFLTKCKHKK
jgi:hypothetical protein